jgi:hypothetical protein
VSFPLINPVPTFQDSSGAPLSSGTIEFRDPTSNDLINSYPTADDADAQTNANTNPLTLNARGEATGLYLEDGVKYKVILKDSAGATVWTQDDVRCPQYTAPATSRTIVIPTTQLNFTGITPDTIAETSTYGEIYVKDNASTLTLNSAAKVQITIFDTNGRSNRTTPDHTNDHITIATAGVYFMMASVSAFNSSGAGHDVSVQVWRNNGVTACDNLYAERTLGTSTDKGSMSVSGIAFLDAGDTLELWGNTSSGSDRTVTFEDVTLSVLKLE